MGVVAGIDLGGGECFKKRIEAKNSRNIREGGINGKKELISAEQQYGDIRQSRKEYRENRRTH